MNGLAIGLSWVEHGCLGEGEGTMIEPVKNLKGASRQDFSRRIEFIVTDIQV